MILTFDNGTLILAGPGRDGLSGQVRDLVWDERVAAWRASAHRYHRVLDDLRAAGLRGVDRVGVRRAESVAVAPPDLRIYQQDAISAWEMAGRRGVVVLPTGAGKTHVAVAAIAAAGRATIVLVPTRALLGQWVARLRSHHDGPIGVYGDGQREVAPITVCTFASALRHMDDVGARFGLVVVDEVHHFGGGGHAEALEMCPALARLGLTATPPERDDELARLDALVGPVVLERRVDQLVGTHLAPFEHVVMTVELTPDERAAYDATYPPFTEALRAFMRGDAARSWADFVRTLARSERGRQLMTGYHAAVKLVACAEAKAELARRLIERHRDDRALIFTADNQATYALSRALLIPAITADIARRERDDIMARFRSGRVRAIASTRVLNEGVDVPDARVAVVLGGRLGKREHVQRIGRVLRPQPGKTALVYEVLARGTFEGRQHDRRAEDLWRSRAA